MDVSETDIVRVSSGDTADIEVDAWLGRTFSGVVTEVANSSNLSGLNVTDQVTNYTVKVRILRDSYMDLLEGKQLDYSPFRPGMSATVEIRTRRTANVLTIPIQSVTTRDTLKKSDSSKKDSKEIVEVKTETVVSAKETQEFVFVIVDEKVSLRAVKTGIQDSQHIEILSGLKEGEMVVSGPYNAVSKTLKDKATVNVVPKEELFDKEEK